jgi:hypothetical protein
MLTPGLIIDIGPNLLTFLLALTSAVGAISAAYLGVRANRKIDEANGHLAVALTRQASVNETSVAVELALAQAKKETI